MSRPRRQKVFLSATRKLGTGQFQAYQVIDVHPKVSGFIKHINNADATMATLDAVLGLDHEITYELVDDSAPTPAPPGDYDQLVQSALAQRPDLQARMLGQQSAQKFARAQWDQLLPSISALSTIGSVPVRT